MSFISQTDYGDVIEDYTLDDLIGSDPEILNICELTAISRVADYLNSRYDTVAIFAAVGAARHQSVVWAVVNLSLFLLHQRLHPNAVPEHRQSAYREVIRWCEKVSSAEINPVGLPVPANNEKDYILSGSETKRNNRMC